MLCCIETFLVFKSKALFKMHGCIEKMIQFCKLFRLKFGAIYEEITNVILISKKSKIVNRVVSLWDMIYF